MTTIMPMMISSPVLDDCPRSGATLRHGFFTRQGGVSAGLYGSLNCGIGSADNAEAVAENRRRVAGRLGFGTDRLITGFQVHSADAVVIDRPLGADARPHADGFVTRTPGIVLGILTADCAPVLLADPSAGVIGAAHAGWRGAFGGILESVLDAMVGLGANRAAIRAAIGPTIAQASYEVGSEFVARFRAASASNSRYFEPASRPGHFLFDLAGYVADRLRRAGIHAVDRRDIAADTYADPDRFFSYRRSCHHKEPDYGRHLSAIAIAG